MNPHLMARLGPVYTRQFGWINPADLPTLIPGAAYSLTTLRQRGYPAATVLASPEFVRVPSPALDAKNPFYRYQPL